MILTTTNNIENRPITEYVGLVFGEVVAGIDFVRDVSASITNFIGGRSGSYEEELVNARAEAMGEMISRAEQLGADAIIGISVDVEALRSGNMMLVNVSDTAVKL